MAIATKPPVERRDAPAISTVYLTDDGLHHTRCGEVLAFIRRRQGLELDFHCRVCHEHIALTEYALNRIPVGTGLTGGPEMAAHTARRSSRPDEAVTLV